MLFAPLPWPVLALLAAGGAAGEIDLSVLANYGVVGFVAAGLIWFAKGTHQRALDRADRLEAENRRLNEILLDRVIPVLISATKAAEESGRLLNAIQRERELATMAEQRKPAKGSPV